MAVDHLIATHRNLLLDGGRADVRSEAGYSACAVFLSSLESTARVMGLEASARGYRVNFSANYRALFPDNGRHYRVDVLEASVDQHSAIWVNGDKFELSAEAIGHAEALQLAWAELGGLLERAHTPVLVTAGPPVLIRPSRIELASALTSLDLAWANFEHKYIAELIAIEEQARKLIVQAVEHECRMWQLERTRGIEYYEAQKALVASIAHLNSVANFRRKGRDDLGADIIIAADEVLARFRDQSLNNNREGVRLDSAAAILAGDVVTSFDAIRAYLREVGRCLERVDPHLCNNVGLVARLVDWEESWEIGARYVRQAPLLDSICDVVSELRKAQVLAPALSSMIEGCDVELFLIVPRIIWLSFISNPFKPRAELLRNLLPHRFGALASSPLSQEIRDLITHYRTTSELIGQPRPLPLGASTASSSDSLAPLGVWELLIRRAVSGNADSHEGDYVRLPAEKREAARMSVEALMKGVEKWSLELQRHCPEDWNQCSSVLIECLTGGSQKQPSPTHPNGKFQV